MTPYVRYIFLLIAIPYMLYQVRKPSKWVGRFFVWMMNFSHSGVTEWGLTHVTVEPGFTILDVGCGGGKTIEKLATIATEGSVYGVDYANGSVAASRGRNARLIEAGRVEIKHASVSHLPFGTDKFDLVTAVETQYYWPNLVGDMQEIRRVLKPGGTLMIVAETYRNGKYDMLQWPVLKLLGSAHLSVVDQRELFSAAGYEQVQIFEESKRGWICAIGKKSAGPITEPARNQSSQVS